MKICGIYKIENLINHKVYIGQSKNIYSRRNHHFEQLENNNHFCSHLQKAYNKYGKNNFSFEILEECDEKLLNEKEIYWLNHYGGYLSSMTYNQKEAGDRDFCLSDAMIENLRQKNLGKKQSPETIAKRATKLKGHPFYGRKRTLEEKQKQSERQKGKSIAWLKDFDRNDPEYRAKLSQSLKGKKKSALHAKHISEGRKGIVFSEEHKKNIGKSKKGVSTSLKGRKKFTKNGITKWFKPEEFEQIKKDGWQEYHTFYMGDAPRKDPWNKGKHCSEEIKKRLREFNKGKKLSEETKRKMAESRRDMIWVRNGIKRTRIHKQQLDEYLSNGWERGKK